MFGGWAGWRKLVWCNNKRSKYFHCPKPFLTPSISPWCVICSSWPLFKACIITLKFCAYSFKHLNTIYTLRVRWHLQWILHIMHFWWLCNFCTVQYLKLETFYKINKNATAFTSMYLSGELWKLNIVKLRVISQLMLTLVEFIHLTGDPETLSFLMVRSHL